MDASYRDALAAATTAALEAGAHLRKDLRRPGGARGSGSHADADQEAERIIRSHLGHEFRYVGEETGRFDPPGCNDDTPIWSVDPNDGTAAYLRGFRGSSVSIGLIHRGIPVLGVVFAYAWPDERGELIVSAESDVSERAHDDTSVVAVSQDADLAPENNARCVAPSRYLALPSIAHRLARVATGDVDAAVCLSGISSWDVAGGHALVRAAGGILIDERGEEIVYDRNGDASAKWCFGGAPAIVRALAKRPWDDVRKERARLPLVWPSRGVGDERAEAAQGALLAALAIDSTDGSLSEEARALIRTLRAVVAGDALPEGAVSNARLAAALAGAQQGREAVSRATRRALLTNRDGDPSGWAVDALLLAEKLLA
ncbi:MAG: inositol monophosphatase family protein [Polyangiales bacterium]